MIDLNIGAGPIAPSPMPKLARITSGEITAAIDEGLQREAAKHPERFYVGASELGSECLRAVYLNAIKAPKEAYSGQRLRVFKMGHVFEDMMVGWIKNAGFELQEVDPATGQQFEFITAGGAIKGHSDGRFVGGPFITGLTYPALWENKALKAVYWNKIVKNGLRKAEPKYFAQMQLYMGYFKLGVCLFTALNKDTAEIYHEVIPYQVEVAQYYSDRGVMLIRALNAGFMPRRPFANPQHMNCRMCNRNSYCWSLPG